MSYWEYDAQGSLDSATLWGGGGGAGAAGWKEDRPLESPPPSVLNGEPRLGLEVPGGKTEASVTTKRQRPVDGKRAPISFS